MIQLGNRHQIVQKQLGCPAATERPSLPGARLALGSTGGLGCFGAPLVVADSVPEHVDVVLLPLELFGQLELLGVQLMEPLPEVLGLLHQLLLVQVVDVERLPALQQGLLLLLSCCQLLALLLVHLLQVATEGLVGEYRLSITIIAHVTSVLTASSEGLISTTVSSTLLLW